MDLKDYCFGFNSFGLSAGCKKVNFCNGVKIFPKIVFPVIVFAGMFSFTATQKLKALKAP
jgi:hypothetical protein